MEKGFTLIEIIITIFLLTVAVVGVYGVFSVMVILSSDSSDRLVAAYLSQEGIEVVRNIRDTNWIKMAGDTSIEWTSGLDNCAQGCKADYTTTGDSIKPLTVWSTDLGENYLFINTDGFYGYDQVNGMKTKFKRKITITQLNDYALKVSSQVFWDEKPNILNSTGSIAGSSNANSVTVEEIMYNWY